jgi:competence protein ComEA
MNKWWLAGFVIVGVLLGVGVLMLVTQPPRGEPIKLLPPPTQAPIMVYVSGEVNDPGLYTLPVNSRIDDVIKAAGGFTALADTSRFNLAKFAEDGEQINVPGLILPDAIVRTPDLGQTTANLVDINLATLEQLDALPEIGPITAQNIIDYRKANGPFSRIEDILDVPGIGPKTFDQLKDLITVGTSP